MIVALEGVDSSGKATQSKILAERLGEALFSFPDYTTPTGKAILAHLKGYWMCGDSHESDYGDWSVRRDLCDALVFQSLMTVNRFEVAPKIHAAVAAGKDVVFDRFWASAVVYGEIDGVDRTWTESIQADLPQPDLWILIDVSPEESVKRRPERRDRYEKQAGLMEKVRHGYRKLFVEKGESSKDATWEVVDGSGTIAEVSERIWDWVAVTKNMISHVC